MIAPALRFYEAIEDRASLTDSELVSYFLYFLTVEQGDTAASAKAINECFAVCDLRVPGRTAAYLSEGTRGRGAKYVKAPSGGYRLHRKLSETLSARLGSRRVVVQTSAELRSLEAAFPDGPKKKFLAEAIDCFEANANRAAVVMSWILALDHLFDYVLAHRLDEFNAALAANPDKRTKKINTKDEFSDLKEVKFIELCRAANIISNDVRKILDEALGVRNTAAHPSGVEVARSKAVSVIEDLVINVIRKFQV
ncbi:MULTISPECIES: hypothetical protein [unclassified Mesorhizobium]|uniref:hypothetical protein n=1 Tax=unclassified Mesorhizobium TaxID=325217 RepID=UPI000BAECDBF|nr:MULTISPECIES: hypothetical protein [unclassified Mesorhizobium]PBB39577.1 hypothetical protein CK221_01785 [Mesorhizobium sp. WSM3868]TGQ19366.1 hypothetical protein EN860_019765 [Mesorhizobium sp. M00.F.Ca.ET.217.01.1.1]TGV89069.1 hypothetical protein EN801_021300 [Mesorhizobium sp. M00.F.Ca.ET.158.01.1.1]